jgi:adenylyl-sulfate kinase
MTHIDETPKSANVVWERSGVTRRQRWDAVGQRGATVWLTGLPASGKSTLATALEAHLVEAGRLAYRLDGDNLRHGLCGDLGFSPEDREENIRRTAHVARLLADSGAIAIVALVSPYESSRAAARQLHEDDGLRFLEVFIDTPLEVCEERDPKGLYARARAGELSGMTGIDDAYEPARAPELHLRPPWTPDETVATIISTLAAAAG